MIKIKKSWEIPESEVTPEALYLRRREFIKTGGLIGGAALKADDFLGKGSLTVSLPFDYDTRPPSR